MTHGEKPLNFIHYLLFADIFYCNLYNIKYCSTARVVPNNYTHVIMICHSAKSVFI